MDIEKMDGPAANDFSNATNAPPLSPLNLLRDCIAIPRKPHIRRRLFIMARGKRRRTAAIPALPAVAR
jgi:hypothetical protein